jgi:arylsulfatase A-like enzyme
MKPRLLLAVLLLPWLAAAAPKPDIVFLLIDDLGFADCGFNGGKLIRTPNIDRLAKTGAVLEHHYVQPVCSPTRSTLLTGRYPTRTGVYSIVTPHAPWGLPLAERTLAQGLREAGYATHIVGKWHLGEFEPAYLPLARGFEHHYGHYFGAIDYFTHIRGKEVDWHRDGQPSKDEGYSTYLLRDEACRVIANQPKDKPLFLYVPFNGVHSPFQAPEAACKDYPDLKGSRQKFAGMLTAIDEAVGRIEEALRQAGRLENTLIVFSSDNGGTPMSDNTPLRDHKGSIFEGGVRAAAFASWPGRIPAGQRIREPMHMVDWYPTLLRLAGASTEQKLPIDGLDIWPMLTTKAASPHDAILCVSTQGPERAAVRMGPWKLLELNAPARAIDEEGGEGKAKGKAAKAAAKYEPLALYNLEEDPGEARNLAAAQPERVKAMQARLAELLRGAVPPGKPGAK